MLRLSQTEAKPRSAVQKTSVFCTPIWTCRTHLLLVIPCDATKLRLARAGLACRIYDRRSLFSADKYGGIKGNRNLTPLAEVLICKPLTRLQEAGALGGATDHTARRSGFKRQRARDGLVRSESPQCRGSEAGQHQGDSRRRREGPDFGLVPNPAGRRKRNARDFAGTQLGRWR
jgi:hypothetical protein